MQLRVKGLSLFRQGRPVLQAQLTLLYSGLFVGLLAAVLLATGTLFHRSEMRAPSAGSGAPQTGSLTRTFDVWPALIALGAAAVAVAAAWWLAGRFLRPLRGITTTAQEISATNLHRRLDLKGPDDELTELGRTLDDLFGRLEASFESQRHFVANASHELRTPLAGQRTLLQVALADPDASTEALRAACEEALQLGDHQEQLIDALLTLASSERGLDRSEHADLATIAEDALRDPYPDVEQLGLDIRTTLAAAPFWGDPGLAERLVANLLDNAVRHNIVGGSVEVSTRTESGYAVLSISNNGPIIPPEDIERLFQPFQQIGNERIRHNDGHGLGLAIVQAIAQAHGAKLTAHPRPEGGLQIHVTFPAEPSPIRNA
jgi:signal transduction histidine kinase